MDLKNLVEGECGGSNPLMRVTSHFNQDQSLLSGRQREFGQRPLEEQFVNEFLAKEHNERLQYLKGQSRFSMNALLHGLPSNSSEEAVLTLDAGIYNQSNEWAQEFSVKNDPLKQFDNSLDGPLMPMNMATNMRPEVKWAHDFLAETEQQLNAPDRILSDTNSVPVQKWIDEFETKEFVEEARHFADLMRDDAEINGTEFMRFIKKVGNVGAFEPNHELSQQWSQNFEETAKESVIQDDTDFWNSLAENLKNSEIDSVDSWIDDYNEFPENSLEMPNYRFTEENHLKDIENPFEEGLRKLQEGDIPSAVLLFEAACQKEPENALAWQYLGTTQAENEHDTAAIHALRQCVSLNGDNLTATMALAVCYTNESMQIDAIKCLKQWIAKNEKYRHLFDGGVDITDITDEKSFSKAFGDVRDTYIKAARILPNSPDADVQCGLGVLFNLSAEYDKAADCFAAALQVRPKDALLWNRLGATLANGSKPEEAVSAYSQALELSPGFLRARFNLGISCMGLKAYREAAEHFLTVLNHQNAGRGPKGQRSKTAMSNNVWSGLRTVMSLMGRQDLYPYIDKQDLNFLNKEFNM